MSLTVAFQWQRKGCRLPDKVCIDPVLLISGEDIAMAASLTLPMAAVNKIPKYHLFCLTIWNDFSINFFTSASSALVASKPIQYLGIAVIGLVQTIVLLQQIIDVFFWAFHCDIT